MKLLLAVLAIVGLTLLGGAFVVWSGAYNVVALAPNFPLEARVLTGS